MQAVQPGVCERGLLRTPQGRAGPQGCVTGRGDWSPQCVVLLEVQPSVGDPDPDPHAFGLPGSGSISQRYGSGSGSGSGSVSFRFSEIMLAKEDFNTKF
jgi:hypothetical protein